MATDASSPRLPLEARPVDACCDHDAAAVQSRQSGIRRDVLNQRVRLLVAATITYNVVEGIVAITAGQHRRINRADRTWSRFSDRGRLGGHGRLAVLHYTIPRHVNGARCGSSRARSSRSPPTSSVESFRALLGSGEPRRVEGGDRARLVVAADHAVPLVPRNARPVTSWARPAPSPTRSRPCYARTSRRCCSSVSLVHSLFGWSWADPIAGLVIATVALKEGRGAWKGDTCCAPGTTEYAPPVPATAEIRDSN